MVYSIIFVIGQSPTSMTTRIMIVGTEGAGKSAFANTLAPKDIFVSKASFSRVTSEVTYACFKRFNRDIVLYDTPGFMSEKFEDKHLEEEIVKMLYNCLVTTSPGFHCIATVIPIGRFTNEMRKILQNIIQCFGREALEKHMIFVITNIDKIEERKSLEEVLQDPETTDSNLQTAINDAGGRYIGIDNTLPRHENENNIKHFLKLIDDLTDKNNTCYTHEMFNFVEDKIGIIEKAYSQYPIVTRRQVVVNELIKKKKESIWERVRVFFLGR